MYLHEIPGGTGHAIPLKSGQAVRLINTFGSQVVDTWALALGDTHEYLSVEHTRRMLWKLFPMQGDKLYSNRRNPMLLLEEDSAPGHHDMLLAACDRWLYQHYGCEPGHRNCCDNFRAAVFAAGYESDRVPNPLNLWMNIPVIDSERIDLLPPVSRPADFVILRALMDVLVVFSACPMDVTPINGEGKTPMPVHVAILDA
jgi:uncharacterized protein YcgI (DUF1989 family)